MHCGDRSGMIVGCKKKKKEQNSECMKMSKNPCSVMFLSVIFVLTVGVFIFLYCYFPLAPAGAVCGFQS